MAMKNRQRKNSSGKGLTGNKPAGKKLSGKSFDGEKPSGEILMGKEGLGKDRSPAGVPLFYSRL